MLSGVGVGWIDGSTFVVNSKIVAQVLNIKASSLSINFRAHGFDIPKKFPRNFPQQLPNTRGLRSWYRRRHIFRLFITTSAEEDAQITTRFDLTKIALLKK
jgi:hypothetical protein